jgi:hypothetical protein
MKYMGLKAALAVCYFLGMFTMSCYVVLDVIDQDGDTTKVPIEITIDSTYSDTGGVGYVQNDGY